MRGLSSSESIASTHLESRHKELAPKTCKKRIIHSHTLKKKKSNRKNNNKKTGESIVQIHTFLSLILSLFHGVSLCLSPSLTHTLSRSLSLPLTFGQYSLATQFTMHNEYSLLCRALLQKRRMILGTLLVRHSIYDA